MTYTDVLKRVPPREQGTAAIVHDTPDKLTRIMAGLHGMPLNRDTYVRLLINGSPVMTDAEFERLSNLELIRNAKGHALLAGLGIGLVLDPLLERCESVTVIEKNADVIALVAPVFPKVNVIHADIREWLPAKGQRFDTIYFDIWDYFNEDTTKDAQALQRRFRKYLAKDGWMRSWCVIANRMRGR